MDEWDELREWFKKQDAPEGLDLEAAIDVAKKGGMSPTEARLLVEQVLPVVRELDTLLAKLEGIVQGKDTWTSD